VFIDDQKLATLWKRSDRCYLLAWGTERPRLDKLVGSGTVHVVAENSGNYLLTNLPLP